MTDAEILNYALEQMSDGRHLAEIADEVGLKRTTLYMRLQATPELVDAYTRAREAGHDARAEKLSQLAASEVCRTPSGAIDSAAVQQLKLRIETDKWLLAKLAPKRYGDKLAIGGADDLPPIKSMPDDQLMARIRALQGKANESDPG